MDHGGVATDPKPVFWPEGRQKADFSFRGMAIWETNSGIQLKGIINFSRWVETQI
jgi:hypothetical protein